MLDLKADKLDLVDRRASSSSLVQNTNSQEVDRLHAILKQQKNDSDEYFNKLDQLVFKNKQDVQSLAQTLTQILQQKPDFSDLEAIAHKIHTKADCDKVQELFTSLKKEVLDSF